MENLKNLINSIVGTEGNLDIPAYWMNKILTSIGEKIEDLNEKIDKKNDKSNQNDVVIFYSGTAYNVVNLTTNEVLDSRNNVGNFISYIPETKTLTTSQSSIGIEGSVLEPFYVGTSSFDHMLPAKIEVSRSWGRYIDIAKYTNTDLYLKFENGNKYQIAWEYQS